MTAGTTLAANNTQGNAHSPSSPITPPDCKARLIAIATSPQTNARTSPCPSSAPLDSHTECGENGSETAAYTAKPRGKHSKN